jgi:hypothetical protein
VQSGGSGTLTVRTGVESYVFLVDTLLELLCWNIRGLNDPAKRHLVREFVASLCVSIVCFEENKVDVIDDFFIM